MKKGFFVEFKEYLLENHKDNLNKYIGYYETLLQGKDKLTEILSDYDKYYMDVQYEEDKAQGYTNGDFEIHFYEKSLNEDYGWQSHIDHYYKISLRYDERYWGYCDCTPDMELYNQKYSCCGNGCDWVAPQVDITKISEVSFFSFEGVARDMWSLKEKWEDHLKEHNEQVKQEKLKRLEEQIQRLQKEKDNLIK